MLVDLHKCICIIYLLIDWLIVCCYGHFDNLSIKYEDITGAGEGLHIETSAQQSYCVLLVLRHVMQTPIVTRTWRHFQGLILRVRDFQFDCWKQSIPIHAYISAVPGKIIEPLNSCHGVSITTVCNHLRSRFVFVARGPGDDRQGPAGSPSGAHQHGRRQGVLYLGGKTATDGEWVGVRGPRRAPR